MVSQTRAVCLAVLVLVAFYLVQPAFASKASRIELKDGEVYENVTFTVDDQYKVITIEMGDWKRTVDFPDIARIIDEDGQDVTADYLGDYYTPPEGSREGDWLSEEEMEHKGYQKRPFGFMVRAGTNYSFPIGDYYEGSKSGIGYGFNAIITVTKNVAIRGTISRSGMKDDLESMLGSGIIVIDDNLSLNAWRYAVSGQYYSWPGWKTGGKMLYYGFAGLGVITHEFSGTMTIKDPVTGEIGLLYATGDKQDKFMFTYGGGFVAMVSKRVGIELGATFDMVFVGSTSNGYYSNRYYGQAQYAYVFDFKIGLVGLF